MEKRKKSVQFSLDVFDERETQCGIPFTCGIPVTTFTDLRFLLPLSLFLVHVQGVVSAQSITHDIGRDLGIVLASVSCSYFGRNHKPAWLGGGSMLSAVSCFLIAFKTSIESTDLWFLGSVAQFLNGVALLLSVSLGSSYFDRNFPRYLPLILGVAASVETAGKLVSMSPNLWLTYGILTVFASLTIALVPKVASRQIFSSFGNVMAATVVNPTDDPSVIQELKNSLLSLLKSEIIMYNVLATVFFFLGLKLLCYERISVGVQAVGFLLTGWFVQFVKPRGKILVGVNMVVGLGIAVHSTTNAFLCRCDFISFTIFSSFFFFSCLGRIGRFLYCIRSVERKDQPVALGTCFGIISLFLIPKIILIDLSCQCDGQDSTFDALYQSPCSTHCCQNNLMPNLVGAGFTLAGVVFDWLLWRHNDVDIYV